MPSDDLLEVIKHHAVTNPALLKMYAKEIAEACEQLEAAREGLATCQKLLAPLEGAKDVLKFLGVTLEFQK
jgi:hypothetical protein